MRFVQKSEEKISMMKISNLDQQILRQKFLADFSNFSLKFFDPKLGEIFFIKQSGYGEQTLFNKKFHLLLKKICPFSDFTFESEVL